MHCNIFHCKLQIHLYSLQLTAYKARAVPCAADVSRRMSVSDALQAVELLRELASVEPVVYEQQQQADAAGVRSVAAFIAELSDR